MFLSLLHLDTRESARGRDLIRNAYALHRRLWRAFGDLEERPFLFRIEPDLPTRVLVQSSVEPDWQQAFLNAPGYLSKPVQIRPLQLDVTQGQRSRFRLRANPTVKKKVPGRENGTRLGIITEEGQLDWLKKKAEDRGFRVLSATALQENGPDSLSHGSKHAAGETHKLSFLAVRFDGILQVTDPERFAETLRKGIGPGKAFGFGLLSVAPV
jgi:CRISPR system Cascade subunit CasE